VRPAAARPPALPKSVRASVSNGHSNGHGNGVGRDLIPFDDDDSAVIGTF